MSSQTVAEATFAVLRRFGVDRVFGNPGSTEMRMFVRWPDDLDYVLGLQEATVVAMADGTHSGRVGRASPTYTPPRGWVTRWPRPSPPGATRLHSWSPPASRLAPCCPPIRT